MKAHHQQNLLVKFQGPDTSSWVSKFNSRAERFRKSRFSQICHRQCFSQFFQILPLNQPMSDKNLISVDTFLRSQTSNSRVDILEKIDFLRSQAQDIYEYFLVRLRQGDRISVKAISLFEKPRESRSAILVLRIPEKWNILSTVDPIE